MQQYIITFEASMQYANSQAIHDMLNMITSHDGHVDFITESDSSSLAKSWTVVYTSEVNLSMYCPKSCQIMYR